MKLSVPYDLSRNANKYNINEKNEQIYTNPRAEFEGEKSAKSGEKRLTVLSINSFAWSSLMPYRGISQEGIRRVLV